MTTARSLLRPVTSALLIASALSACQPGLQPITAPVPSAGGAPASDRPITRSADLTTSEAVLETAVAVFGDSADLDGIADGALDEAPTWDIDVRSYETHERVEHYMRLFTGPAKARMAERMSRGTHYEPMIRAKMRDAGLPEDLYYLALIESGYDPHAFSSAAAVGMWQFMAPTAKEVGLRIDWWVDERRDPARATDAAVSFLGSLQRQFGSLYLAAAAYNGGPGRVARGLNRFASAIGEAEGDDRFFALAEQNYLHSETKNYVPQLIAAALVAKTPDRFDMEIEQQAPFAYDSVLVDPGTSMGAIARAAAIPLDSLMELNAGLLRGVAPPDRSEWFRIPLGSEALVTAAYAALSPDSRRGWAEVEPKGASLADMAKRHDVTTKELGWYNPTLRTGRGGVIAADQTVRVPTREAILGARLITDATILRFATGGAVGGVHVVRRGESLSVIGQRYGVSVARLKSINGLRSDRIRIGQRLTTGGGGGATAASSTRAAGSSTSHTVRRGESLSTIAERYGTSVSRLKSLNGLRSDRIRAGQKLVVRRS